MTDSSGAVLFNKTCRGHSTCDNSALESVSIVESSRQLAFCKGGCNPDNIPPRQRLCGTVEDPDDGVNEDEATDDGGPVIPVVP